MNSEEVNLLYNINFAKKALLCQKAEAKANLCFAKFLARTEKNPGVSEYIQKALHYNNINNNQQKYCEKNNFGSFGPLTAVINEHAKQENEVQSNYFKNEYTISKSSTVFHFVKLAMQYNTKVEIYLNKIFNDLQNIQISPIHLEEDNTVMEVSGLSDRAFATNN